jgi:hypothetical protein
MMPDIGNKKSSGRSAMSGAHASSINSTGKNALKHNRGSVRKDNQHQTITLMPGPNPNVNQSVNIPNNHLKSIDYSEGRQSKVTSGSRRASGRPARGVSAASRASKRKLQTVTHDADLVNFADSNI